MASDDSFALQTQHLTIRYDCRTVLRDVTMNIPERQITAIVGRSGCGKSSLLGCFNRLNEYVPGFNMDGTVLYRGRDIYDPRIDVNVLRRYVGMVFQRPNLFPTTIFKNVRFGAKINGYDGDMKQLVQQCLTEAALWDEVKDRLHSPAEALSGGQKQRLCIARALAINPDVILLDEPCSALDPLAVMEVEKLLRELRHRHTLVLVTHNLDQAARISDTLAFLNVERQADGSDCGVLKEYGPTEEVFANPKHDATRRFIEAARAQSTDADQESVAIANNA